MNNNSFKQHFINALLDIGIYDYKNRKIVVEPIYEKDKWTFQTYDDIMRLQILPKTRELTFQETIDLFTFWEGYYPCWIEISTFGDKVYLKTSLRMRKANKVHCDNNEIYPFKKIYQPIHELNK